VAYFGVLRQHVPVGSTENRENSSQYRRSSDRDLKSVFMENVKSKPTMSTVVKSAVSCGSPR
jgi:hypothetical protein